MSDSKPFAEVLEFDEDVWIVDSPDERRSSDVYAVCGKDKAEAERIANLLNAAVARERREAAAEALEEAARDADCYAEDTMEHLGHQEGLLADAIRLRVVRWLRTRAAALRKGDV